MGNTYVTCKKCHYKFKSVTKKICPDCEHLTVSQELAQYEQSLMPPLNQYDINKAYQMQVSCGVWPMGV